MPDKRPVQPKPASAIEIATVLKLDSDANAPLNI